MFHKELLRIIMWNRAWLLWRR